MKKRQRMRNVVSEDFEKTCYKWFSNACQQNVLVNVVNVKYSIVLCKRTWAVSRRVFRTLLNI